MNGIEHQNSTENGDYSQIALQSLHPSTILHWYLLLLFTNFMQARNVIVLYAFDNKLN